MKSSCTIIAAALAGLTAPALADGTITKDTAADFRTTWKWDPEAAMQDSAIGKNWNGFVEVYEFGLVEPNKWTVNFAFTHKVAPHGEETNFFSSGNYSFAADAYGIVVSAKNFDAHEAHRDDWQFFFDRSMAAENTVITLIVRHNIPAPPVSFGIAGLIGLIPRRRRNA